MAKTTYLDDIEGILSVAERREMAMGAIKRMLKKKRVPFSYPAFKAAIRRGKDKGVLRVERKGAAPPGGEESAYAADGGRTMVALGAEPLEGRMAGAFREQLQGRREERARFEGTVERFGFKRGGKGQMTVLLRSVVCLSDDDRARIPPVDHVWMNKTKGFERATKGDKIRFYARVRMYKKREGYDYRLFYPTGVEKAR